MSQPSQSQHTASSQHLAKPASTTYRPKQWSLQKRLLLWVLASVIMVAVLAQVITIWNTRQYLNELQVNNLKHIADLVDSRRPLINRQLRQPRDGRARDAQAGGRNEQYRLNQPAYSRPVNQYQQGFNRLNKQPLNKQLSRPFNRQQFEEKLTNDIIHGLHSADHKPSNKLADTSTNQANRQPETEKSVTPESNAQGNIKNDAKSDIESNQNDVQNNTPDIQNNIHNNTELLEYDSQLSGQIRVHVIPKGYKKLRPELVSRIEQSGILDVPVGFSKRTFEAELWSVYRKEGQRTTIIVRQQADWQQKLNQQAGWRASLPILLAVLLLLVTLPLLLKRLFSPVQALTTQIANRDHHDLTPIELAHLSGSYKNNANNQLTNKPAINKSHKSIKQPSQISKSSTLPSEFVPLVVEINQLLQRVEAHINQQQRFVANAAHELRTPLTAISLQVQRLQKLANQAYADPDFTYSDVTKSEHSQSEHINLDRVNSMDSKDKDDKNDKKMMEQKIQQSITKLGYRVSQNQHLVEQLLTLARLNVQQLQANTTKLLPVLSQAIDLLLPIADDKNIQLAVDNQLQHAPQLPELDDIAVNMDNTSLLMLLKNLLQNAILYTPNAGQVTVNITGLVKLIQAQKHLSQHSPKRLQRIVAQDTQPNSQDALMNLQSKEEMLQTDALVIQICDSGIGMAKSDYQKVFNPFVRLTSNIEADEHISQPHRSDRVAGYQTSNQTSIGLKGTGLGLAIVQQICHQAGVQIYLSATKENGNYNDNQNVKANTKENTINQGLTVTLVFT